jgi:hypothetical protein
MKLPSCGEHVVGGHALDIAARRETQLVDPLDANEWQEGQ